MQCLPYNIWNVRDVLSIVLHALGCIIWAIIGTVSYYQVRTRTHVLLSLGGGRWMAHG